MLKEFLLKFRLYMLLISRVDEIIQCFEVALVPCLDDCLIHWVFNVFPYESLVVCLAQVTRVLTGLL